ncbi:MAG: class I SAM-dependent methyltransferase [Planctomycetota bacterium]
MPSKYPEFRDRPIRSFYKMRGAPVHSVMLVRTEEEALRYPCGDIELGFCEDDGFVTNLAFDHTLQHYSEEYEETQGFSPTFNRFHERLAKELIERYDLHGKRIIEIGCGKGDFINMLCELGGNRGLGVDPAYRADRDPFKNPNVQFLTELYGQKHVSHGADFICCKMTLEHIPDVTEFVRIVRSSVPPASDAVVFFQIPEVRRVLSDVAFWDIYYEHCSYFSRGSLARVFRRAGFDVHDVWTDYDDQYLMIEAYPAENGQVVSPPLPQEESVQTLSQEVDAFSRIVERRIADWRTYLKRRHAQGDRIALWGGGSKAVAFLTTLDIRAEVRYAVDINPHKAGTWLVGTGQQVVQPSFLQTYDPQVVIVMNSIYRDEIARDLAALGLSPQLVMIDEDPTKLA